MIAQWMGIDVLADMVQIGHSKDEKQLVSWKCQLTRKATRKSGQMKYCAVKTAT